MKFHLITSLLAFGLLLALTSCQDFLDEEPRALQTVDGAFLEESTARLVVNGMYDALSWGESTSIGLSGHSYEFIFGDICTDDAEKGSTNADQVDIQRLKEFNTNGTNGNITTVWGKYWVAINRANVVLEQLTSSPIDARIKAHFEGEARFVRGNAYLHLVTIFGGVPIFDAPVGAAQINARAFTRASIAEVYAFLDDDLEQAVALLPKKGTYEVGRATQAAAAAYLARSYMYQIGTDNKNGRTWNQVLDLTDRFIAGEFGNYALAANYATIWSGEGENNIESIWEIQAVDNGLSTFERGPSTGSMWTLFRTPFFMGGWGFCTPTADLYNAYEPNDPRRHSTLLGIGEHAFGVQMVANERSQTGFYPRKALMDPTLWVTDKGSEANIRKFRYADILLMNAEAAYHTGDFGKAVGHLTTLRNRASASTFPQGYDPADVLGYKPTGFAPLNNNIIPQSGQALLDFILLERRRELGLEQVRFMDLVRTGRYMSAITNTYRNLADPADTGFAARVAASALEKSVTTTTTGNPIPLFPIPTRDLEDWGLMQNTGY